VAPSAIVPVDTTGAPAVSSSMQLPGAPSPDGSKLQLQEAFLAQYSPDDGQVSVPGMCGV
jgi:hypothetical protein